METKEKEENNFEIELHNLLNRYSKDNESNTPDYILAGYLKLSLDAFNQAVNHRERWYGRRKSEDQ